MTIIATVVYLLRGGKVLLIRKKRGFGAGKYNGVGGKVEPGENLEESARREVLEEVGVRVKSLEYRGWLEFYSVDEKPDWVVHVFVSRDFEGGPRRSEEADPYWFDVEALPLDEMWEDDRYWLPRMLRGEKIKGVFRFDAYYTRLLEWHVEELREN
uniref:Oxidized purine nucleoside triphosphate hydrolase n=1 Tax=Thermofilum pendens TaxID=2269 RepID=A0A7C4B9E6_THEPE